MALSLLVAGAGCGKPVTTITVAGNPLVVVETNYGKADYYCDPLANGQYMVIITDSELCARSKASGDGGVANRVLFHAETNTNLRLIFPSKNLLKIPPTNTFKIGKSDCKTSTAAGTEAIAVFSHQIDDAASYATNLVADSGTVTIQYPVDGASTITGTYDLTFGADNIKGSYTAQFCSSIVPGFAN